MAAVASQVVKDLSPVPVLDVIDAGALGAIAATSRKTSGRHRHPHHHQQQRLRPRHPPVRAGRAHFLPGLPAVRAAGGRRLARSPGHPPDRAGIPQAGAGARTSTRWCWAAPTTRCSSRCCRRWSGNGVKLVDSAEAMAEETAALLAEINLANPQRGPAALPLLRHRRAAALPDHRRALSRAHAIQCACREVVMEY